MATEKRADDGAIEDSEQRQTRIASLPEKERELARECGRFADLCNFLSQNKVAIPATISDELARVSVLQVAERAVRMKALNEELMKFLNGVGLGSGMRQ